jgi:arabinose-5-phosphate isomerase
MSSTTVSLVICDAVANLLAFTSGSNINSFRKNHPGGKLGRSLFPVMSDMKPLVNCIVLPTVSIFDVLSKMSGTGFVVVEGKDLVDDVGIFTDGDLRRVLELELDVKGVSVGDYCSYSPLKVGQDMLVRDAEELMDGSGVTSVLVSDHVGKVIGIYRK